MVSGLVTSPCDQLRIFSGEARLMRMASKSATAFPKSKGLERYKVSSTAATHARCQRLLVPRFHRKPRTNLRFISFDRCGFRETRNPQRETLIGGGAGHLFLDFRQLDQFHIHT